jgi:Tfp pilus assembly protein FimT
MRDFPLLPSMAQRFHSRSAFSLIEMLGVICIIALLSVLGAPVINNLTGGRDIKNHASILAGLIEQARVNSMTQGTYTYLCFYPKTDNSGFIVMVLNSSQGIGDLTDSTEFNADLRAICRPYTFDSAVLTTLTNAQQGNMKLREASALSFLKTSQPKPYPLVRLTGSTATTSIRYALRFNPRGEMELYSADEATDSSNWATTSMVEIGLQSVKGGKQINSSVAALQIAGLTGQTHIYLP